jgi:hypothetical protein
MLQLWDTLPLLQMSGHHLALFLGSLAAFNRLEHPAQEAKRGGRSRRLLFIPL